MEIYPFSIRTHENHILCRVVDDERSNYPEEAEEAEEYVLFSFLSFFRSYEGSFLFARDHCMMFSKNIVCIYM